MTLRPAAQRRRARRCRLGVRDDRLEAAAEAMPDRTIHWVDFDAMLGDFGPYPCAHRRAFRGSPRAKADLTTIMPVRFTRRYSKAMEHDYSPALSTTS